MNQRYFGQIYDEAEGLLSRPELRRLVKAARDGGQVSTTDLLEAAVRAMPGTAIAQVGKQIGHPRYQHLTFGQVEKANAIVLFMDVRGFTRLSIELENDELIRILQKLSIASVATVYHRGGYVGDFTGDGVMAFFDGANSITGALQTGAELLGGVREFVNPALKRDGDTGVRVAVGLEFGEVCWTRIGFAGVSQIKPISEVTYVAGKLATREHTDRWECCIGEQLAASVPQEFTKKAAGIKYTAGDGERTYQVFNFAWEQFEQQYVRDPSSWLQKLSSSTLRPRRRSAVGNPELSGAPAIIPAKPSRIPGPADAPVPPRNRQVG